MRCTQPAAAIAAAIAHGPFDTAAEGRARGRCLAGADGSSARDCALSRTAVWILRANVTRLDAPGDRQLAGSVRASFRATLGAGLALIARGLAAGVERDTFSRAAIAAATLSGRGARPLIRDARCRGARVVYATQAAAFGCRLTRRAGTAAGREGRLAAIRRKVTDLGAALPAIGTKFVVGFAEDARRPGAVRTSAGAVASAARTRAAAGCIPTAVSAAAIGASVPASAIRARRRIASERRVTGEFRHGPAAGVRRAPRAARVCPDA